MKYILAIIFLASGIIFFSDLAHGSGTCSTTFDKYCYRGNGSSYNRNNSLACPLNFFPVCSITGKTYSNRCLANRAGASIQCNGLCPCNTVSTSRGYTNFKAKTPYAYPPFYTQNSAQNTYPNKIFSCSREYKPVCGVDGKVYSNTCLADKSNVRIACEGNCNCLATGMTSNRTYRAGQDGYVYEPRYSAKNPWKSPYGYDKDLIYPPYFYHYGGRSVIQTYRIRKPMGTYYTPALKPSK